MNVTERDVANIRRISKELFDDTDFIEIKEVKDSDSEVMVRVKSAEGESLGTRNAFAGTNLRRYHRDGYVAVAVGGGDNRHTAWFERADTIDFGSPDPEGEYDLFEGWCVSVSEKYAIIHHEESVVSHVGRDGWTLDEYVLRRVLPDKVTDRLEAIGFEKGDVTVEE